MVSSMKSEPLPAATASFVLEAGCDEAGRGCLAGPVCAAAVILPDGYTHPLLNDSKVALHAVKTLGRAREAAKYVAAPYHDGHFYTFAYYVGNLTGIFAQSDSIYAITLRSHQRLAAEFEQYSLILCFHITNLDKITH